jgi:hypothetical protein
VLHLEVGTEIRKSTGDLVIVEQSVAKSHQCCSELMQKNWRTQKVEFDRYMCSRCVGGRVRTIALDLTGDANLELYPSTSFETIF